MTSIGAMILRSLPPAELVRHAQAIESLYDELWVVEDLPFAGGIAQAAAVLASTTSVVVGHGIAPAPFRNPAALAMEWAALAEMFPGRVACGVGHGVPSWMALIGERVASPLTLLDETISSVRAMLAGERVTVDGRYVHLDDVSLIYPPANVPLVSAGVLGPKSLRLSGAVADGTILPEGHGPAEVAAARRLISEGQVAAGRIEHHRLTVFAGFFVGNPDDMAERNPDAPVGWEAVGETVDEVAAKLRLLVDADVDSVVLVPMGSDAGSQLVIAGEQIVPSLR